MASSDAISRSAPDGLDAQGASLRADLKSFIVEHLRLPDVDPSTLPDHEPLVGSGLDLDSIDILELVTGIEKKYGLRFDDPALVQKVFTSVDSIAAHIAASRGV